MSMAGICRGFRRALASRGFTLKPRNDIPAVFPCIHYSEDWTMGLKSCFVQKHAPYFLHHRQFAQCIYSHSQSQQVLRGYHLGNSTSNNFIQDPLDLDMSVHPPPKYNQLSTEESAFVNLEAAKAKLRGISDACISFKQLLDLCINCTENSCENEGREIIKSLEQSGDILRLGHTVYLHPRQLARAMENVLPLFVNEVSMEELKTLETEKAATDRESERQARKELWYGLGFFSLQIAVLLRLTFWEFSWDIMEPVCFYFASAYFIIGYVFFLKTKKEPTYQSFHAARFRIKQRKLMKMRNFNMDRFTELQRNCRVGRDPN